MDGKVGSYELNNGVSIPRIGFGTWQVPDGDPVINAVAEALRCGYTHIDTASAYQNERGVGTAIKKSGIPRTELFVTTKIWNADQGYKSTLQSFEQSLEKLGMDYVDLYLIHWPKPVVFRNEYPGRMRDTWTAMEELYKAKKIRAIGVSNFLPHHLDTLMETASIVPVVNQIELHPGYNQAQNVKYCREKNILIQCWSPLASGRILGDNTALKKIAEKYGKSVAQVVLRWHLQNGLLPIPKSVTSARIAQNLDVFDFELDEADVRAITDMPESGFSGLNPDEINF